MFGSSQITGKKTLAVALAVVMLASAVVGAVPVADSTDGQAAPEDSNLFGAMIYGGLATGNPAVAYVGAYAMTATAGWRTSPSPTMKGWGAKIGATL